MERWFTEICDLYISPVQLNLQIMDMLAFQCPSFTGKKYVMKCPLFGGILYSVFGGVRVFFIKCPSIHASPVATQILKCIGIDLDCNVGKWLLRSPLSINSMTILHCIKV